MILTRRENQAIVLFSEGFTTKEVAKRLGLGHETIATYRKSILEKMEAKNIVQAVVLWDRQQRNENASFE